MIFDFYFFFLKKIFPLIKEDIVLLSTFRSYIAIYHEAVIVNILEI